MKKKKETNVNNGQTTTKKKGATNKKPVVQQESRALTTSMGLQYQIVRGIIHSPWIVIPLSHNNDVSK